jgi:hypothetical protein
MSWAYPMLVIEGMPRPAVVTVIVIVGIAVMGVVWFALRFWLASTRSPDIKEVHTPKLDKLNCEALKAMGGEGEEDDEEAPEGLKDVVSEEEQEKPT